MNLQLNLHKMPPGARARALHLDGVPTRCMIAVLCASLLLGVGGCATPMLQSQVQPPERFAAAQTSEATAPETDADDDEPAQAVRSIRDET